MAHPPMPETAFELTKLEHIADLRRGLLDVGFDRRKVGGCIDWVVAMATGQPATESPGQLSAYRKMLRALLAEQGRPWPPPRARRRNGQEADEPAPKTAERGAGKIRNLVAVASIGAASMVGGAAARASEAPISPPPALTAPAAHNPGSRSTRRSEGRRAA